MLGALECDILSLKFNNFSISDAAKKALDAAKTEKSEKEFKPLFDRFVELVSLGLLLKLTPF
jgi:hypothetical protein